MGHFSAKRIQRFAPQVGETYGAKTRLALENDPRDKEKVSMLTISMLINSFIVNSKFSFQLWAAPEAGV